LLLLMIKISYRFCQIFKTFLYLLSGSLRNFIIDKQLHGVVCENLGLKTMSFTIVIFGLISQYLIFFIVSSEVPLQHL
jgi:hypothetical protein